MRIWLLGLFTLALAGCATAPVLPPVAAFDPAALAETKFKSVLVAGDPSVLAFDHAAERLVRDLRTRTQSAGIVQLTAREDHRTAAIPLATTFNVLSTVEAMQPGPNEGCLLFITAHGAPKQGLALPRSSGDQFLAPSRLDIALARGCGNAPTIVVLSGCYTGTYLESAMTRDNRIVLTAARADRASFGCGANNQFTFFDQCLLDTIEAMAGATWRDAFSRTRACVATREVSLNMLPSEPQAHFGSAVAGMKLPWK